MHHNLTHRTVLVCDITTNFSLLYALYSEELVKFMLKTSIILLFCSKIANKNYYTYSDFIHSTLESTGASRQQACADCAHIRGNWCDHPPSLYDL